MAGRTPVGPVCGARTRVELREIAGQRRLARPGAGLVRHDQRCIDGHQAFVAGKRSDGGFDARVVVGDSDVQEPSIGIDNCHASLILLAPRKIQSNELHRATVPYAA